MTSTHDGHSDGHGPTFMGLYAQLLIRYLRVPAHTLSQSLDASDNNTFYMQVKPVFIDEGPMRRARAGSPTIPGLMQPTVAA